MKKFILFSGTSNLPLARKVAQILKVKLGRIQIEKFRDGETYVNIEEEIKAKKVFILQSGCSPANENLMELLIIVDAIRRLKPQQIIAILPFYPYRRQERKVEKGEPITAELVAKLLEAAGVNKIITLDLHSPKIKEFFRIPLINLRARSLFGAYFKKRNLKNYKVLAPDEGALGESRKLAQDLKLPVGYIQKSRERKHDIVKKAKIVGNIKNKNIIMIDDEVNTGGTIVEAIKLIKKARGQDISLGFTHPVLSKLAVLRLKKLPIKEMVVTDSIFLPKNKKISQMKIISVAKLIAETIK